MNYQPNYYNTNPYMSYFSPQQGTNMMSGGQMQPLYQQQQMPQMQAQPMSTITGKIVDGKDIVTVTEVPMGGYGVFPKADLNEIYVKEYNLNGTTRITTYRPVPNQVSQSTEMAQPQTTTAELLEHIQKLEGKIDSILERGNQVIVSQPSPMQQSLPPALPSTPVLVEQQVPKKEVNLNAF